MDFLEKVKDVVINSSLIKSGENIGVAVSGGVDSMCLLFVLLKLKKALNINITVLHFEHGIRGEDSIKDAEFVKDYCEKSRIKFYIGNADVPSISEKNKISIEAAARYARYSYFEKATKQFCLTKIALAHHLDDQAETVILNLLRGSGTRGLLGMKEFRSPNYIRPLLNLSKSEILEYAKEENIEFVHDKTNDNVEYSRNKLRHEVIDKLCEINENAVLNIKRTADILRDDENYFDIIVLKEYKNKVAFEDDEIVISLENWGDIHVAIKRRLIRRSVEQYFSLTDIEFIHIEYIIKLSLGQSGKRIEIGKGLNVEKAYDKLYIFKNTIKEDVLKPLKLNSDKTFSVDGYDFKTSVVEKIEYTENNEIFDLEKIKGLVFRNSFKNDYIKPLGMTGKKKLTDYFSDKKIPLHKRKNILVLAKNDEIVWIVGYGISENFKVVQDTKKAFRISYNKRIKDV